MSKIKPKKQNTFIDMTAMSDVTVLLLTFFMLTATFLEKEPIQVTTPASVIDIKIPDGNLMTILVKPSGECYLNLDMPGDKRALLGIVGEEYGINFTPKQVLSFVNQPTIGMPVPQLPAFLDMSVVDQDALLKTAGIPADSTNNQLKGWIQRAISVNEDLKIAIKADRSTPYPYVKNVITTLQELRLNRFNLITTLEGMPPGFY